MDALDDSPSGDFPKNGINISGDPRYTETRIEPGKTVDGARQEGEIRAGLQAGGHIVAVVVVVSGGPGAYEFYPFLRLSWERRGYFAIVKHSKKKLRSYNNFMDLLGRLELPLDVVDEETGKPKKGGFGYRGPVQILFREDPDAEKLGAAISKVSA